MSTVRIMCRPSLQHFPTVIELSPPDPSGAIRMIFHRLQENPWRARHFLGVTILISTEAKCLAPEYFNKFQEKRVNGHLSTWWAHYQILRNRSLLLFIIKVSEMHTIQSYTKMRSGNLASQPKATAYLLFVRFSAVLLKRWWHGINVLLKKKGHVSI